MVGSKKKDEEMRRTEREKEKKEIEKGKRLGKKDGKEEVHFCSLLGAKRDVKWEVYEK